MSIIPVNVPVPVSGDGPIVSIANIVGEKTVQLSGIFEGYYNLLGTHDGTSFVAVASFDASGPEGIKQTIPGAISAVRLRSAAQTSVAVVCEVSGVAGAGQNGFGTIASLTAGFSGLTPIIDTSIFIPPTGSEVDTCFFCRGDFEGPITILGSIDGIELNPIGEFRVARRPEGSPRVLELPPVLTQATVRYVRLKIPGAVTGPVVVTMGGRVPATGGGGPGVPIPLVITDASSTEYQAAGTVVTPTIGASSIVGGTNLTVDPSNSIMVVLGSAITAAAGSSWSSIVGNTTSCAGVFAAMLGPFQTNSGANSVAMVGTGNRVGAGSHNAIAVGTGNTVGTGASQCLLVGKSNTVGNGDGITSSENFIVGDSSTIVAGSLRCAIFGGSDSAQNRIGTDSSDSVIVGDASAIGDRCPLTQIIGNLSTAVDDSPNCQIFGNSNPVHGSSCVVVGSNNIAVSGANHILVGGSNDLQGSELYTFGGNNTARGTLNLLVGNSIDNEGNNSIGMGFSLTINANDNVVMIGTNCSIGTGHTIANVLIGRRNTQGNSSRLGLHRRRHQLLRQWIRLRRRHRSSEQRRQR